MPEEPGADEEVCLLPDTEREISEADKAEAEKVLAEKRKQAEGKPLLLFWITTGIFLSIIHHSRVNFNKSIIYFFFKLQGN